MRLHRFYISQPLGEEVVIDTVSLIHQWTNVFRYEPQAQVILFNGDGFDYTYTITEINKKRTITLLLISSKKSYIPKQKINVSLSVIKKDAFELTVQKLTELGITSITPILSSRSENKNLSFERLTKIVTEAAEQCGRGDIPNINNITTLQNALNSLADKKRALYLSIDGRPLKHYSDTLKHAPEEITLFIGPEGGWSPEDRAHFHEHNIIAVSLGETVLRAETAAIVGASQLVL